MFHFRWNYSTPDVLIQAPPRLQQQYLRGSCSAPTPPRLDHNHDHDGGRRGDHGNKYCSIASVGNDDDQRQRNRQQRQHQQTAMCIMHIIRVAQLGHSRLIPLAPCPSDSWRDRVAAGHEPRRRRYVKSKSALLLLCRRARGCTT